MSEITLQQLNDKMAHARSLRTNLDAAEETAKNLKSQYQEVLRDIQMALEQHNLKSFKNEHGNAIKQRRWSCSVPKEPVAREQFFGWLKQEGYFDHWITVHSQTLNSEYKKLYEAAAKEGELFEIPGVGAPTVIETVVLRSK